MGESYQLQAEKSGGEFDFDKLLCQFKLDIQILNSFQAFGGFFSQIGRLHNVHHIWCYKSFQERKEIREKTWAIPGWDDCVAYTVPLIREMHCRVLVPTEFSPTK